MRTIGLSAALGYSQIDDNHRYQRKDRVPILVPAPDPSPLSEAIDIAVIDFYDGLGTFVSLHT